jgi:hypothetical protein
MITDALHLADSIASLNWDSMFKPSDLATTDIATLRAARNVAEWRAYLPEDCVEAMINGGWHWTT